MSEAEQKEHDMIWYNKGKEDGEHLAKSRIAIELVNVYENSGSWWRLFRWWGRGARIKAYVDKMWNLYGPTEAEYDELYPY